MATEDGSSEDCKVGPFCVNRGERKHSEYAVNKSIPTTHAERVSFKNDMLKHLSTIPAASTRCKGPQGTLHALPSPKSFGCLRAVHAQRIEEQIARLCVFFGQRA